MNENLKTNKQFRKCGNVARQSPTTGPWLVCGGVKGGWLGNRSDPKLGSDNQTSRQTNVQQEDSEEDGRGWVHTPSGLPRGLSRKKKSKEATSLSRILQK